MNRLNSIMRCIGFFFVLLVLGGCQVNKDKSSTLIYKILTNQQWDAIKQNGFTLEYGTELDKKDGFFHFSQAFQVEQVAKKFFPDLKGGVLLEVNADMLQSQVTWQENKRGKRYPHVYGEISMKDVLRSFPFATQSFNYSLIVD